MSNLKNKMENEEKQITSLRPDFFIIPKEVFYDEKLNSADKFVFSIIYWLVKISGICYAGNEFIAEVAKLSPTSIGSCLDRLEKRKYIKRKFFDKKKRHRERIECLIPFNIDKETYKEQEELLVEEKPEKEVKKTPKKKIDRLPKKTLEEIIASLPDELQVVCRIFDKFSTLEINDDFIKWLKYLKEDFPQKDFKMCSEFWRDWIEDKNKTSTKKINYKLSFRNWVRNERREKVNDWR